MKYLTLIFTALIFLGCSREWDNPVNSDDDLKNTPNIVAIEFDSEKGIVLTLNHAYSSSDIIILERKSAVAYETIGFKMLSQATLADTLFDPEINGIYTYRIRIEKGKYKTDYSPEKEYVFNSTGLEKPLDVLLVSVELQGIRLEWKDKSNHEDGYKIEKDEGSGFTQIADISADLESYFDAITGQPATPLNLSYRIKAYNTSFESDWVTLTTEYSGLGSPTNLKIVHPYSNSFEIEWQDNSTIETEYIVERKKDLENFIKIVQLSENSFQYSDQIIEMGNYQYRVKAVQNSISSVYSNIISYSFKTPVHGLLAYYPFNGNSIDASGNENNCMVNGPILTQDRFGNSISAYEFDGVDDNITVQNVNQDINNLSMQTTLSSWIYIHSFNGSYPRIIDYHEGVADRLILAINSNTSNIQFNINDIQVLSDTLPLNFWLHALATYDGVNMKIYINGVLENIKSTDTEININNNKPIIIGNSSGGIRPFDGAIDDIRIYNRALTEDEIQTLYHEGGWDE
ncbi:MAG: hypothetical protein HND50_16440 [Calditrichaeota bacterium]|nr:hypothetical protein [Calditrichota bacterium]